MQEMPGPLGNQRLGIRRLEICALPAMLPPGADHLERAVLPPTALDGPSVARRRHTLSLRRLPLQLRELPPVQGAAFVAEEQWSGNSVRDYGSRAPLSVEPFRSPSWQKKWFQVTRRPARSPTGMHGQNMASESGVT